MCKDTWHSLKGDHPTQGGGLDPISYLCNNCEEAYLHVWVRWSIQKEIVTFEKCGHHPKFEIHPAKRLEQVLGTTKATLYRKGFISRHPGHSDHGWNYQDVRPHTRGDGRPC